MISKLPNIFFGLICIKLKIMPFLGFNSVTIPQRRKRKQTTKFRDKKKLIKKDMIFDFRV